MANYIEATSKDLAVTLLKHGKVSFATRYEIDDSGIILECEDWFGATIIDQFNGQCVIVTSFGGGMCFAYNVTQLSDIVPVEVAESTLAYFLFHDLRIPGDMVCVEAKPISEPDANPVKAEL